MVSGDGIFRLESDRSRTAAGGTLYQWQDNQWVLVGYHSKKLPAPVQNYGVTELELTGLLANIHWFEQKLRNNYFEVIVDHKAIDYMIKSKHQPTTSRLTTLFLKLMEYTFDLKYLEGNKLKVSDTLSHLYIEEKHKVSDVIPLNFLLHYSDRQLTNNYHKAAGIDHLAHTRTNKKPETCTRYACKAHNQQVERYQAGNITPADKANKAKSQLATSTIQQRSANEPKSSQLDAMQQMVPAFNTNKLQIISNNTDPLSLHQDQLQKQVVNTIREVPEQFFKDLKHVIPANDKLSIFQKHIPKQREIDALLANLCKRVLHNLMVNLDTKDLIEAYDTSTRYKDIYHYVQDSRLSGNNKMQKKIAGEANSYVMVNDLLFKIVQYKESGKYYYEHIS